jgi:hypothetical protein
MIFSILSRATLKLCKLLLIPVSLGLGITFVQAHNDMTGKKKPSAGKLVAPFNTASLSQNDVCLLPTGAGPDKNQPSLAMRLDGDIADLSPEGMHALLLAPKYLGLKEEKQTFANLKDSGFKTLGSGAITERQFAEATVALNNLFTAVATQSRIPDCNPNDSTVFSFGVGPEILQQAAKPPAPNPSPAAHTSP